MKHHAARAIVSVALVASAASCSGDSASSPSVPEPEHVVEAPLGEPTGACEIVRRSCSADRGSDAWAAAARADPTHSIGCLRTLQPRDQLATLRELRGFFDAGELCALELEVWKPLRGRVEILDLRKREEVIAKLDVELEPAAERAVLIVCVSNHTARVVFQAAPGAHALHVDVPYAARRDKAATADGLRFSGVSLFHSIHRTARGPDVEWVQTQDRDLRSIVLGAWSRNGAASARVAHDLVTEARAIELDDETRPWRDLPLAEWPEPVIAVHLFVP